MNSSTMFSILGGLVRGLSAFFSRWPLLALAVLALSPVGPHVRWEYSYVDLGNGARHYTSCTYFGSRGLITPPHLTPECPGIVILDARKWAR